jgi:hypothetical protein
MVERSENCSCKYGVGNASAMNWSQSDMFLATVGESDFDTEVSITTTFLIHQ